MLDWLSSSRALESTSRRGEAGCGCRRGHAADVGADLARSGRGRLNVARDLAGRFTLLLETEAAMLVVISLICAIVSVMPPIDRTRLAGGRLHGGDLRRDFLGSLGGLIGKRLHFGGNDGKAAAGFAGAPPLRWWH